MFIILPIWLQVSKISPDGSKSLFPPRSHKVIHGQHSSCTHITQHATRYKVHKSTLSKQFLKQVIGNRVQTWLCSRLCCCDQLLQVVSTRTQAWKAPQDLTLAKAPPQSTVRSQAPVSIPTHIKACANQSLLRNSAILETLLSTLTATCVHRHLHPHTTFLTS